MFTLLQIKMWQS